MCVWRWRLQAEVNAKGFVQGVHQSRGQRPTWLTDSFDGDAANLFGLGLQIVRKSSHRGREQDLERVDPLHVRGDGHDRDDAAHSGLETIGCDHVPNLGIIGRGPGPPGVLVAAGEFASS